MARVKKQMPSGSGGGGGAAIGLRAGQVRNAISRINANTRAAKADAAKGVRTGVRAMTSGSNKGRNPEITPAAQRELLRLRAKWKSTTNPKVRKAIEKRATVVRTKGQVVPAKKATTPSTQKMYRGK